MILSGAIHKLTLPFPFATIARWRFLLTDFSFLCNFFTSKVAILSLVQYFTTCNTVNQSRINSACNKGVVLRMLSTTCAPADRYGNGVHALAIDYACSVVGGHREERI